MEVVALIVIGFTLGATFLQWHTMERTLDEMAAQTALTKQQAKSTHAAIVTPQLELRPEGLVRTMRNSGNGIARNAAVRIQGVRKSLPDRKPIGQTMDLSLFAPQIPAGAAHDEVRDLFLTPDDWKAIQDFRQTLEVLVDFSFDDGFDDVVRKPRFCWSWINYSFVNPNGTLGLINGWIDCDQLQTHVDREKDHRAAVKLKQNSK